MGEAFLAVLDSFTFYDRSYGTEEVPGIVAKVQVLIMKIRQVF